VSQGVPEHEIAFVHDATTDAKRDAMYEKVRRGEIRIILGSTSKLGTGTNIQNKMIAALHLDCPWKPAEIEQRNGRVVRPGNENDTVSIMTYVSKNWIDDFLKRLETDPGFLENAKATIQKSIKKHGLSPRYERPDEKYDDLFPPKPKDKTLLASTLDEGKHYFAEVYTGNDFSLYKQKSELNSEHARLYILYEGWMLGLGSAYQIDDYIKDLTVSVPDYRRIMTDSLEQSLADPDKWANPGYAIFLGRLEEALEHNQPIREQRQEERDAEQRERDRADEEQRQKEQNEYNSAIYDAEQAIYNDKPVKNSEIRGTSLILCLFRDNGIDVPLKTQGWIKSALHSVHYDEKDNEWTYRYYNKTHAQSNSFSGCFEQLVSAIGKKYDTILDQAPDDELDVDDELEP